MFNCKITLWAISKNTWEILINIYENFIRRIFEILFVEGI